MKKKGCGFVLKTSVYDSLIRIEIDRLFFEMTRTFLQIQPLKFQL